MTTVGLSFFLDAVPCHGTDESALPTNLDDLAALPHRGLALMKEFEFVMFGFYAHVCTWISRDGTIIKDKAAVGPLLGSFHGGGGHLEIYNDII